MWVTGTQSQAREVESELRVLVISMQEWVRQAGTWWCSFHRGTGKLAAGEERPAVEQQEISAQGCLADVSEGRFIPAPVPTVLSVRGLRQNPRPDITLVLLQCHLAYPANKRREHSCVVLLLHPCLLHFGSFGIDFRADLHCVSFRFGTGNVQWEIRETYWNLRSWWDYVHGLGKTVIEEATLGK